MSVHRFPLFHSRWRHGISQQNPDSYKSNFFSMISKGSIAAFWNGLAPVSLFNAISLPSFSAGLNYAPLYPPFLFIFCSRICLKHVSPRKVLPSTAAPSSVLFCVRYPRRTEGLAKASMVASTITKTPFNYGNMDAYMMNEKEET
jgi:hypothetical protein